MLNQKPKAHPNWCEVCFFLGGDSQHPKTEETACQVGVRLGLSQSQVRKARRATSKVASCHLPATFPSVGDRMLYGQLKVVTGSPT